MLWKRSESACLAKPSRTRFCAVRMSTSSTFEGSHSVKICPVWSLSQPFDQSLMYILPSQPKSTSVGSTSFTNSWASVTL